VIFQTGKLTDSLGYRSGELEVRNPPVGVEICGNSMSITFRGGYPVVLGFLAQETPGYLNSRLISSGRHV
jgi:hypothetical protein